MEPIVVVGAGISGVACAQVLRRAGLPVAVVDRGRTPGGRMATHRVDERPVDVGASYLTASDPRFVEQVERWRSDGLARPWTDTFLALAPDVPPEVKTGPVRWGAPAGLRSLVEDLSEGLDLTPGTVQRVDREADGRLWVDDRAASAVVLAVPDPQARRLLGPGLAGVAAQLDRDYDPALALTTVWAERTWDLDGAFVKDDPAIEWVADDGRRRGDGAPVLVAHSTATLARDHLEAPEAAVEPMLAALRRLLHLDGEPRASEMQRWTYAKPAGTREATYLLTDELVGACGDGWTGTPKVEGAYLSGLELGEALVERLS